jgi:hypothetical protein
MESIGNKLYTIISNTRGNLFNQGELAQLTFQAFDKYATEVQKADKEKIIVSFPVGYTPSKEAIKSNREYTKDELVEKYNFLALNQLPINGIYNLVTLMEAMFTDLLKIILLKYPKKISNKRQVNISTVLSLNSIDEIHSDIINKLLNELTYKSPTEFIKEFKEITSVNLLETPATHRYKEIKATRDIYIHNNGIANEIYTTKAETLVRAKVGQELPINIQYFLESYEYCLQLTEFLESKLNEVWTSEQYEKELAQRTHNKTQEEEQVETAEIPSI